MLIRTIYQTRDSGYLLAGSDCAGSDRRGEAQRNVGLSHGGHELMHRDVLTGGEAPVKPITMLYVSIGAVDGALERAQEVRPGLLLLGLDRLDTRLTEAIDLTVADTLTFNSRTYPDYLPDVQRIVDHHVAQGLEGLSVCLERAQKTSVSTISFDGVDRLGISDTAISFHRNPIRYRETIVQGLIVGPHEPGAPACHGDLPRAISRGKSSQPGHGGIREDRHLVAERSSRPVCAGRIPARFELTACFHPLSRHTGA